MTYVISDIHGREDRFHSILDQIQFSMSDVLYVLGDVIDRNPDGIRIMQEIMEADNMRMILGNHEYMMLNVVTAPPDYPDDELLQLVGLWYLNGGEVTYSAFLSLPSDEQNRIVEYIEALPLNREVTVNEKDYLLVHGSPATAYSPDNPEYSDATVYAVWNRLDPYAENGIAEKTILCGHTPTIYYTGKNPMEVFSYQNVICIDCGCAFPNGRLACICLETGKIYYSMDKPEAFIIK